jgi:hypothetical protein
MTPQLKVVRHNFRDYALSDNNKSPSRNWVKERMKIYSNGVKSAFRPKLSEKKVIEMEILKEKMRRSPQLIGSKVKLELMG